MRGNWICESCQGRKLTPFGRQCNECAKRDILNEKISGARGYAEQLAGDGLSEGTHVLILCCPGEKSIVSYHTKSELFSGRFVAATHLDPPVAMAEMESMRWFVEVDAARRKRPMSYSEIIHTYDVTIARRCYWHCQEVGDTAVISFEGSDRHVGRIS
jgi:hypothetical protein